MLNIFSRNSHTKFPRSIALIGLVMLVLIGGLACWSMASLLTAASWRRHTYNVIYEVRGAETALGGTKSALLSLYLKPKSNGFDDFTKSQQALLRGISTLDDLVEDNIAQTARIKKISSLVNLKLPLWNAYALDLQKGVRSVNVSEFQDAVGLAATDPINATLQEFETAEHILLLSRNAEVDRTLKLTSAIVIAGILLAFFMFFTSNMLLQKEMSLRLKTEMDLKAANQKAIEASELKSSFLANMSHEIRTPLNGIIGMSKLLEHTPLNARQVDYVETIKTSSNSLLSLINEILDFSKIESGKLQLEETNFELASLLKSAISIVDYSARSKGLEIVTDISTDVPEFLMGDPLRLRQVLLNLLNNAIKFSEKGAIRLRVYKKGDKEDGHANLLFEIIDQGVGFDPETRSKLFQSFSQGDSSMTRRYGGTGLGLAISKQIVEMMHGKIDVDSVKGVGSKFYFDVLLKLAKKDSPIQAVSTMRSVRPMHGNILIAEDNRVNQKVVSEMLALMGCNSTVVSNGKEAIEALRSEDYNVVLMDAQMPIMDGYEATRLIRRGDAGTANKTIPILATTANAIKGDIETCLEAGMNDYISKPISYNDLALKIEKWMSRGHNVLDKNSFKKLQEQDKQSAKPFLKELIELFGTDSSEAIKKMRGLLATKDFKGIPALAHNLKSSAAVLGALRLRDLSERIERSQSDAVSEQQLILLVDSLDKELQLVIDALKNQAQFVEKTADNKSPPPPPPGEMSSSL